MVNANNNHMIIKNHPGKEKPWNLQNPEISMVSLTLLFSINILW